MRTLSHQTAKSLRAIGLGLCLAGWLSSQAHAAKPKKFLRIQKAAKDNWVAGETLCLYFDDREIGCGNVLRVTPKDIIVRLFELKEPILPGLEITAIGKNSIDRGPGNRLRIVMRTITATRGYTLVGEDPDAYRLMPSEDAERESQLHDMLIGADLFANPAKGKK